MNKLYFKGSKILKILLKAILYLLLIALLAIAMRVFLFSVFLIPSPSMEPALLCGDRVIVNKLILGPRIFKNLDFLDDEGRPDAFRLKGFRQVRRNDVLVFNLASQDWNKITFSPDIYYVKRCVAIPGDTFSIENGIYKVAGSPVELGNVAYQKRLSDMNEDRLKDVYDCFPFNDNYAWNMKNFGPLYVPKKGDSIRIDSVNFILYKKLIEYETGGAVSVKNNKVYLDNRLLSSYVFKLNYYFMAGDSIFDSLDSRYWGLLPEDHIVGKAMIIWKSVHPNTDKIRWDRVMKMIE